MCNIFSDFLCFLAYFAHLGTVSNNFNSNGQNRILGKWNYELWDDILKISILGEQLLQRGQ